MKETINKDKIIAECEILEHLIDRSIEEFILSQQTIDNVLSPKERRKHRKQSQLIDDLIQKVVSNEYSK